MSKSLLNAGLIVGLVAAVLTPLTLVAPEAALAQRRVYIADNNSDADDDVKPPPGNPNHKAPPKLSVPGYQTYWCHDAVGYHPCIIVALEGDGVTDMTGVPVQLQAQFRVIAEGLLTIGRTTTSFSADMGQRQLLTEPMRGKRAFELPLDQAEWPVIECKIMAKVGDANSDESQNLLTIPCRVQAVAMTDDDARAQLNFNLGSRAFKKKKASAQCPKSRHPSVFSTVGTESASAASSR